MSKSRRLLSKSAVCRFDWHPSRWLTAAICVLASLAAFSLLASDLPRTLAWPLAFLAIGWGLGEVRRYARQPSRTFLIPAGAGEACCDGVRMDALQVFWRGPLAFLRWRDPTGTTRRLAFFPDTLPAATRRELRLAMQCRETATAPISVAG